MHHCASSAHAAAVNAGMPHANLDCEFAALPASATRSALRIGISLAEPSAP